jgi:hypothetical protein
MYYTSSVAGWVLFVAVYTKDVIIFGFSWAFAGEMCCALYTSWVIAAVAFCVSELLAVHTLGDFSLDVWCFE